MRLFSCLTFCCVFVVFGFVQKQRKPNVVILLSDDQGWGDLSINGNRNLSTPNIDQIGKKGAQFSQFFVQPVCSPTRAELLTGRYHPRSGVYSTSEGGEQFNLDETTLADVFKKAGYATGAFGKWHSGMQYPYHPNGRGFDEFYGFCSGHWGDYFSPPLEHNGEIVQGNGFTADDFTEKAMAFMEQHQNEPFLVYVPFNTPHSPMQVPDAYWKRIEDKPLTMRASQPEKEDANFTKAALAMCENLDWNVGRLMQKLQQLNLEENTIVVYFNDNGPNAIRWNGGMKGIKGSTDEGGVRSPLLVQYPRQIKANTRVGTVAGAIDLLPTLADLAGINAHFPKPLDGISLKPSLTGKSQLLEKRQIFAHWNGRVSLRTQQYRLDHEGKLYDVATDPAQTTDLSLQQPALATQLKEDVLRWKSDVLTGIKRGATVFPVGHPAFKTTQLPARDAQPKGGITRSNRHPNSTFFTNWKTLQDAIVWEVEVLEAGTFEAEIYYTCAPANVGSTVQLVLGNAQLTAQIAEAHNPPLRGMENDRSPRIESYVKDFKLLKIGKIQLSKGKGQLIFKALQIKGEEVMDFRTLVLRRTS
jgi:arylsulfatase A-like enzyme